MVLVLAVGEGGIVVEEGGMVVVAGAVVGFLLVVLLLAVGCSLAEGYLCLIFCSRWVFSWAPTVGAAVFASIARPPLTGSDGASEEVGADEAAADAAAGEVLMLGRIGVAAAAAAPYLSEVSFDAVSVDAVELSPPTDVLSS